ncbi:acyltransferase family protein [Variovorax sp. LT1P1]|uniref:acyltransferase family protein n=1 Tax=Variovorax sp. LT1P1 TaxID=3443730 RepID=UPI003F45C245
MQSTGRIYYLDAARALLMFLGIPYHIALIYQRGNSWAFATSPETSLVLDYLAQASHTFRMPAFFLLAGYFAMLMLERKDSASWLSGRFVKLGVPLVAAALLLNPISLLTQDDGVALARTLGHHWLAHLWFLPTLLVMFAALALMKATPLLRWFERLINWVVWHPVAGIAALLLLAAGIGGTGSLLSTRMPHFFVLHATLPPAIGYMPFVLLGAAMRFNPKVLKFMSTCSLLGLIAALVPLAFVLLTSWSGPLVNITRFLALTIVAIGLTRATITLCCLLLDRPSRRVRKLVDASFTMYLVHFPLFNLFFMWLEPAGLQVWPEFLVLVAAVTAASYAAHIVIARNGILTFMFNGARAKKMAH